jgi:mutator family transposase
VAVSARGIHRRHARSARGAGGPEAKGLSAPVVARLKRCWSQEYQAWRGHKLGKERWVYLWADGIYPGLRAEDERLCVLVAIGVNERGQKRFLAIEDGMRESKASWADVLRDLKKRGLLIAPKLAVGDGALGFWAALEEEIYPETRQQRCWVHKTANVLNYLWPRAAFDPKVEIQASYDVALTPVRHQQKPHRSGVCAFTTQLHAAQYRRPHWF